MCYFLHYHLFQIKITELESLMLVVVTDYVVVVELNPCIAS